MTGRHPLPPLRLAAPLFLAGAVAGRFLVPLPLARAGLLDRCGLACVAVAAAAGLVALAGRVLDVIAARRGVRAGSEADRRTACILAAVLAFAAGAARAWPARIDGEPDDLPVSVVEGVVRTPPRSPVPRADSAEEETADTWFELRLPDGGTARVTLPLPRGTAPPDLLPGDGVRVLGRCRPRRAATTPGAPEPWDPAPGPHALDVDAPGRGAVERIPHLMGLGDGVRRLGERVRRAALARLREACPDDRTYGLLACVLTGDRAELPPDIRRAFRDSGTAHLLAVSGLHVVFLLAAAAACGRLAVRLLFPPGPAARVRDALGLPLSAAAVLLYCAVCRFETPVVRASVFVAARAVAASARRRSHPLDQLALAAGIVVAADPAQVFDLGFHLSFLAVAGLVLLAPRFREALFPDVDVLLKFPEGLTRRRRLWLRWFPGAAAQTAAAQCATAPVIAAAFGVVQPAGAVANFAGIPAFAVIVPLSAALALSGGACVPLTDALSRGACGPVVAVLDAMASAPGASVGWGRPPPWALGASAALLVVSAALRKWTRRHLLLPAASFALLAVPARLARPPADEVVVLDVGHGLCVILRSEAGGIVVYDAGGRATGIGERVVVPALRELGVRRIDAFVLSHEDSDHVGAFAAVADAVPVGSVLVGAGFGASPLGMAVLRRCGEDGIPVRAVGAGDSAAVPGVSLRFLHPPPDRRGGSENVDSVVALATVGAAAPMTVLLTGDLEGPPLESIAAAPPFADALLLPHHGRAPAELEGRLAAAAGVSIASSAGPEDGLPAGAWSTSVRGTITLRPGAPPAAWTDVSGASPPPRDRRRTER